MRALVVIDVTLEEPIPGEVAGGWAWQLERQVEELEPVKRATVVDVTIELPQERS